MTLNRSSVRFAAAGAVNTAIGLLLFPVMDTILRPFAVPYLATLVLCHIIAVTQSYYLGRVFVFRSNQKLLWEYVLFSAFQWAYLLANMIVLPTIVMMSGRDPRVVQVGISLVAMICSYVWQAQVVFRRAVRGQ
jgi:putative flippase GtrA